MNSPFMYKPGTIMEEEPEKVIRMSDMNQLVKNETIDDVDIKILVMLHEFRFSTAGTISQYFKSEVFYNQSFAKNRLRKFVKYGLVRRFYITFNGTEDIHKRTVNFYSLSEASLKYLKKYLGKGSYDIEMNELSNIGDVLSLLALNQSIVNYSMRVKTFKSYQFDRVKKPRQAILELEMRKLKVYSVRRDQRLDLFVDRVNKDHDDSDNILILTEDELSAVEIYKAIHGKTNLKILNFITDLMMVSDDMFDSFINAVKTNKDVAIKEYKLSSLGEV